MAEIKVPEDMAFAFAGIAAPSLNRFSRAQWEEYLRLIYLAGYQTGMRDSTELPLACRDCTCMPILDAGKEVAQEISKNCPIHGALRV
jgi:hypothetical protein